MKKRHLVFIAAFLTVLILILPSLIVLGHHSKQKNPVLSSIQNKTAQAKGLSEAQSLPVSVYRSTSGSIEHTNLNHYLIGVVACEEPSDFRMEALKAQAVAARTYIVNRLMGNTTSDALPKGANVIDTTADQVYKDPTELKKLWGNEYTSKIKRIEEAVDATDGEIITYKGTIIAYPAFFSTSNGYTEDAGAYWDRAIPYLKSVPSEWDLKSPKYKATVTLSVSQVEKGLGVNLAAKDGTIGSVKKRTVGKRVAEIDISGHSFTGRQVREKLNLRSADFVMNRTGDQIQITTYGYGHGIGMSQFGANGMAKAGKTYKEIIAYYYTGTNVSSMDDIIPAIKEKL